MKKTICFTFFICSMLLVRFANAQTITEIINKHVAAMGGKEKIMTLSSVVMTATFIGTGDTSIINTLTIRKHLVGSRMDIEANNTKNYQIITHENGWIYAPVQGEKAPRQMAEGQFKSWEILLDLQGPFVNSAEKGYKIELDGKDTVDGKLCNKLKVTAPNKNVTVYSIDSKTNFIVKASTKLFQFGGLEDVITTFSDYKQNADGYWFAYSNITPRGKTNYNKIITNVPVDEEIFKVK